MTFWQWINRERERSHELTRLRVQYGTPTSRPGERHQVTIALFALAVGMLLMARENPALWEVKLFEILIQGVILTGLLNMVLAFHFAANKSDEVKTVNAGKAFDAVKAVAENASTQTVSQDAGKAADKVAAAAVDEAETIKDGVTGVAEDTFVEGRDR